MNILSKMDTFHLRIRENRWFRYFAVFNRIALAAGFLPSGIVKIMGERFTDLSNNHPMGQYLEALHQTGYYYTFIGILQVTAAILLLIPRTVTLGAIIYFPIILNICILTFAVRFDGSLLSSPLMVLANLYLLCWDYHKIKFILPLYHFATLDSLQKQKSLSHAFPIIFFSGVITTVFLVGLLVSNVYEIKPYNTESACKRSCKGSDKAIACYKFCHCIHIDGQAIDKCLKEYHKNDNDPVQRK